MVVVVRRCYSKPSLRQTCADLAVQRRWCCVAIHNQLWASSGQRTLLCACLVPSPVGRRTARIIKLFAVARDGGLQRLTVRSGHSVLDTPKQLAIVDSATAQVWGSCCALTISCLTVARCSHVQHQYPVGVRLLYQHWCTAVVPKLGCPCYCYTFSVVMAALPSGGWLCV